MQFVTQIFLCIISLVVTVDSQGGGGGGGGGGFGAGGCAIFVIVVCVIYCCTCCKGKPRRSNLKFVNNTTTNDEEKQLLDIQIFQSGLWTSRYFQYNKWHGPHGFTLSFDSLQSKVTGSGSDDVGMFTIDGTYSTQSRRMGLTKTYQYGTGNPVQNLGHTVTIQLEWNRNQGQFEGKWYVRTIKFHGEDLFELKFDKQQQLTIIPIYEKV